VRILAVSHNFLPGLGGIETAADALTRYWAETGHEVTIATETPGEGAGEGAVRVLRRPSPRALLKATRWADVVWHNHISLRAAWTLLLAQRPWIVTHQGWLRRSDGALTPAYRAKRLLARRARAVAISRAIAADLPVPATVIPNPYRDRLFRDLCRARDVELAFVGRFVSDKGAAVLIEALAQLKRQGRTPRLRLIGEGPERDPLAQQAHELGVAGQVGFTGPLRDADLAEALNRAEILIVPSLYPEPFGIVALEGIACGCAVIASGGGGLPEAVGPCGLTFPNGDSQALAARIGELLTDRVLRAQLLSQGPRHLAQFTPGAIGARYLQLFEQCRGAPGEARMGAGR
jgi:glycogen synthase